MVHMAAAGSDELAKLIINIKAETEGKDSDKSSKPKRQDGLGYRGAWKPLRRRGWKNTKPKRQDGLGYRGAWKPLRCQIRRLKV